MSNYKSTVFLPQTDFPLRGNLAEREPQTLARWTQENLYDAMRAQAKMEGREVFILHDGPPYANGAIHIGHALNKILKDVVVRSRQALGFDAPFVPGWDCHGLPIEWKVEERLRAEGGDKDSVPILDFRAECRAFARHWLDRQAKDFARLGILGDWQNPYTTMTATAEAAIVGEIHQFVRNGLLYRGKRPVMWSVVEKTALADAEIEYHDHKSLTIWVAFPVIRAKHPLLSDAQIVIWTTTPWTIPGNRAIAYGAFRYAVFKIEGSSHDNAAMRDAAMGQTFVVAVDRLAEFQERTQTTGTVVGEVTADDLAGVICAHPLHGWQDAEGAFDYDVPLYHGDFVTTEAGTGFVHIAPGHGEDDFRLGQHYGISYDDTVADDGRYLPNVTGFAGLYVYNPDGSSGAANGAVLKALSTCNRLLAKQNLVHSYPHSWRSRKPVIFRTTPQWFIALDRVPHGEETTLRQRALKAIESVTWYPERGVNRLRGMLENRPDWCISRQRAWGVPLAFFVHRATGEILRDEGVLERIRATFAFEGADAWYTHPPTFFLGGAYNPDDYDAITDIVDVWFESGSTHAFCLNRPDSPPTPWSSLRWPADLYLEGSDQHRGWFQSSLLEACGTRGEAPFRAVLTHGFVLDGQGRKMSKSLGNVVDPQHITETHGADILRLWVVSADTNDDVRVGDDILNQTRDLYRRIRNTLRYLLGALCDMPIDQAALNYERLPELERTILHRLTELDADIRTAWQTYRFGDALHALHTFCTHDLSAFWFDIRKDSLYCDSQTHPNRQGARAVMSVVFDWLVVALAPIVAFTAEEAWRARHGSDAPSVHLQRLPDVPDAWRDDALAARWRRVRTIRRVVTGALEETREKKRLRSSLEGAPHLWLSSKEDRDVLATIDAADVCLVSTLTLAHAEDPVPDDVFRLSDVAGVAVRITLAHGEKCERCWRVLEDVGTISDHPTLCVRCADVVTQSPIDT